MANWSHCFLTDDDVKLDSALSKNLSSIEKIDASHNKLTHYPESFDIAFPNLRSIDLRYNRLLGYSSHPKIDATIFGNPLRSISLQYDARRARARLDEVIGTNILAISILVPLEKSMPIEHVLMPQMTALYAPGANLSSTIPERISTLTGLRTLNIPANSISGTLPKGIKECTMLRTLIVNKNNLTGTIPDEICHLRQMHTLMVAENEFRRFPSCLGNMTSLEVAVLHSNIFAQALPDSIYELTNLHILTIQNCKLVAGSLSPKISQLANLRELRIGGTKERPSFHGRLPEELFQLTRMDTLSLRLNNFTSTLPESITRLTNLVELSIDHNHFQGTLQALTALKSLLTLHISKNCFEGPIPSALLQIPKLKKDDYNQPIC